MKKDFKMINLIRLISCIAVLLYHLKILKGGYLAVCTFFVLSGYLACISSFKKERFSFKTYYLNKLKKIYLPLIIVIFVTIAIVSLCPNIFWMNLKPETTSVILGYNNFWQLNANLDYFTPNVNSPFTHLWYIAILIQFDLIFPFIFLLLRKIENKINKLFPCFIAIILSIAFCMYFYFMSLSKNIMFVYYDTLMRFFSIFLGVALGFIFYYYEDKIKKTFSYIFMNKLLFYINLIFLIALFIFADSSSSNMNIVMILASLISCILINFAVLISNKKENIFDKFVSFLSSISYEVYLFQYPVIYLFQEINIDKSLKLFLIIIITLFLSYLLHFSLASKKHKNNIAKYILLILFILISSFGIYKYYLAKDYTSDMKMLEEQLNENEQLIQIKQKEYLNNIKKEKDDWQSILSNLENGEKKLKEMVSNLQIIGIGDSVMLGAVNNLYDQFPNGYFDAGISRTDYVAQGIIKNLKAKNMFGDPIILNLGANGDCGEKCKIDIMEECRNNRVFWVNVTNDDEVGVNKRLRWLSNKYNNLYLIDWETISKSHPEYFVSDRIHLTSIGQKVFADVIYNAIYKVYLDEYNAKKDAIIKEHEEKEQEKITFYGNNILINLYDYIKDDYQKAEFISDNSYNYETLRNIIKKSIDEDTVTNRLVFMFDSESEITIDEYQKLFDLCEGKDIYLVSTNPEIVNGFNNSNIKIINLANIILKNNDYVFVDGIHLSSKGNIELKKILNYTLNNNNE